LIDLYKKRDIKKIVQWLEKQYDVIIAPIDSAPSEEELLGNSIGSWLGKILNKMYGYSSPEEQIEWEKDRWMHHGAFGFLIEWWGRQNTNSFLIGLGTGLMQSDIQDKDKWFDPNFNQSFLELKQLLKYRRSS